MKIAIIHPRASYYQGGGEKVPLNLILELTKDQKTTVDLYTTHPVLGESALFSDFKRRANPRVHIIEIPVPNRFKILYSQPAGQDRSRWDTESLFFNSLVYPLLEKNRPDIIWCNYIVDCLIKPPDIPSVLYLCGCPADYLDIRKAWLAQYDLVTAISKHVLDRWNQLTDNSLPHSQVLYSAPILSEDIVENKTVFPDGGFNILFVGRLIERKGVQTLIEAVSKFRKKLSDVKLNILGTGPYEPVLKAIAKKQKVKVNFLGHQDKLGRYYRAADVCVFPSYGGEGLMGVVMEAMACGSCVITTIGNGNEELIDHKINGWLVKPKQTAPILKALMFVYDHPEKARAMGRLAEEKMNREFTWAKHVAEFNEIIKPILKNN